MNQPKNFICNKFVDRTCINCKGKFTKFSKLKSFELYKLLFLHFGFILPRCFFLIKTEGKFFFQNLKLGRVFFKWLPVCEYILREYNEWRSFNYAVCIAMFVCQRVRVWVYVWVCRFFVCVYMCVCVHACVRFC